MQPFETLALSLSLLCLFGLAVAGMLWHERAAELRALEREGSALGLYIVRAGPWQPPTLTGVVDGLRVVIQLRWIPRMRGTGAVFEPSRTIVVRGERSPQVRIDLRAETAAGLGAADIVVRDPRFDANVRVSRAAEVTAVAALGREARGLALRLVGMAGAAFEEGVLTSRAPSEWPPHEVVAAAPDMVRLVKLLSIRKDDVPGLLERNAADVKDLGSVRALNLSLLQSRLRGSEAAARASAAAVSDADDLVRVVGASYFGDAYADLLVSVASDWHAEMAARAQAVEGLAHSCSRAVALPHLEVLLGSTVGDVRCAVIEGLGHLRHAPAIPAILEVLPLADPATAGVIARAFGRMADASAQPALLVLLSRDEESVRMAAAAALGEVGTLRAVVPLINLARERGVGEEVRNAAGAAVAAIQRRVGHADAGRLAVADEPRDAGALSIASDAGALAVTDASGPKPARDKRPMSHLEPEDEATGRPADPIAEDGR